MPNWNERIAALDEKSSIKKPNKIMKTLSKRLNLGYKRYKLKAKDINKNSTQNLSSHGIAVRSLALYIGKEQNPLSHYQTIEHAYLLIKYEDGQQALHPLEPDKTEGFVTAFEQSNAYLDNTFLRSGVGNIDWQSETQSSVYDRAEAYTSDDMSTPSEHYQKLHQIILFELQNLLAKHAHVQWNIIDGGCGNGALLKKLESTTGLPNARQLIGFDFNPDNVSECLTDYSGRIVFKIGNLLHVEKFIAEQIEEGLITAGSKSIILLCGSLTRLVLKNTNQSIEALHSIVTNPSVHYIMGGGLGEPLINRYMARQMGFKLIPHPIHKQAYFFCFERMSQDEILTKKRDKIRKDNVLDLRFCPNPSAILEALKYELRNASIIDLSFCKYHQDVEKVLDVILMQSPGIQLYIAHHDASVIHRFSIKFIANALVIDALQISSAQEKPVMEFNKPHFHRLNKNPPPRDSITGPPSMAQCLGAYQGDDVNFIFVTLLKKNLPLNKNTSLPEAYAALLITMLKKDIEIRIQNFFKGDLTITTNADLTHEINVNICYLDLSSNENIEDSIEVIRQQVADAFNAMLQNIEHEIIERGQFDHLELLLLLFQKGFAANIVSASWMMNLTYYDPPFEFKFDFERQLSFFQSLAKRHPEQFPPEFMYEYALKLHKAFGLDNEIQAPDIHHFQPEVKPSCRHPK